MTGIDLFAVAVVGAGAAIGWFLIARRWWRTLFVIWLLAAGLGVASFIATGRADDWDGFLYLAIWMFFAGPLTLGAAVRGAVGWWRNRPG